MFITWREANAFDVLRELERRDERFDTVVLDPPAFAKSKQSLVRALAGYNEINLRAMRLLAPGGTVFLTAFVEDGVIHAGNSSQISDGAAALLVTTSEKAYELDLTPIVRYRAGAVTGADPVLMLTGPIPATERVLRRSRLSLTDIDHYEVNEAFASVPLAWQSHFDADPAKLNPRGGAIALGHPLGCSGVRLLTTMLHGLEATGGRFGLQTMCEAGGMANATLIERL